MQVNAGGAKMANEKQRRAFISYSRTNKEFATKLAKGLRSAGYPIWFDLMDIPTGSRWDDEVEKALRECSVFMIILTPASIASENVKDEIGYAIDHGKRILPVLLENCEVPLRLRRFQYVDFTTKSFEEGFESAKELLGDLIDEASVPAPARTSTVENQMTVKAKYERYAPVKPATEHKDVRESGVGRKKPVSKGLVIIVSVVAVVVLVIAGIGFRALYKMGNNDTPVVKPATETPVVAEPATKAPVVESTNANGYGIGSTMTGNDGMTLLYVPAGEFTMGSDNGEADEKPVHTVYLDAFWIDQTEVTNKQYQACVDAGTCEPPSASSTSNNPSYYGNHFLIIILWSMWIGIKPTGIARYGQAEICPPKPNGKKPRAARKHLPTLGGMTRRIRTC
jgi:hypothetical protein